MRRSQKLLAAGQLSDESLRRIRDYEESSFLSSAIDAQAGWACDVPGLVERGGTIYVQRTHNNESVFASVARVRGCLTTPCRTCQILSTLGDHRKLDRHRPLTPASKV